MLIDTLVEHARCAKPYQEKNKEFKKGGSYTKARLDPLMHSFIPTPYGSGNLGNFHIIFHLLGIFPMLVELGASEFNVL